MIATNKDPLVSVIIPCFNGQDYIGECLDSLTVQSYRNLEIIVVDDCSSDNTPTILKAYKKRFPNLIKIYRNPTRLGRGGDSAANVALRHVKGSYIARIDADDIALPHRIETQVRFLQKNPDVFLVGSQATVINGQGQVLGMKKEPCTNADIYSSYNTFNPIIHPSVMYRSHLPSGDKFTYEIRFSVNNDFFTFFKGHCEGLVYANIDEPLIKFRIHGSNNTFTHIRENFKNTLKIRAYMFHEYKYRYSFKDLITTACQCLILFTLPEKMVTKIYLFSKGITNIDITKKQQLTDKKLGFQ